MRAASVQKHTLFFTPVHPYMGYRVQIQTENNNTVPAQRTDALLNYLKSPAVGYLLKS